MIKLLVPLTLIVVVIFSAANYLVPKLTIHLFTERYVSFNQAMARGDLARIQQRFTKRQRINGLYWPRPSMPLMHRLTLSSMSAPPFLQRNVVSWSEGKNSVRLGVYGMLKAALTPLESESVVMQRLSPPLLGISLVFWAMNVLAGAALLMCLLLWVRPH